MTNFIKWAAIVATVAGTAAALAEAIQEAQSKK